MFTLSVFARTVRDGWIDRRTGGLGAAVHRETGLPLSASDLLFRGQATGGKRLALAMVVRPRQLALAMWRRDGGGVLATVPREELTADEAELVEHCEHEIKRTAHDLAAEFGTFDLRPPIGAPTDVNAGSPDGRLAFGADGLTAGFRITPRGLDYALQRTEGTEWEHGPRRLSDCYDPEVIAAMPQWARREDAHR